MAYQLRARKDLTTAESQERTDIPVSNLTEQQVTVQSQTLFVPPQLSETQSVALPTSETNLTQSISDITAKPEMETTTPLDTLGPTRQDPGLDSAALSARTPSTDTYTPSQQLAPTQASAFNPQSTDITTQSHTLAEEVGPPSSVVDSRDISLIASQTQHVYASVETSSLFSSYGSWEVKTTYTASTTLAPDMVVARTSTSSFRTPTLSHITAGVVS